MHSCSLENSEVKARPLDVYIILVYTYAKNELTLVTHLFNITVHWINYISIYFIIRSVYSLLILCLIRLHFHIDIIQFTYILKVVFMLKEEGTNVTDV